MGNEFSSMNFQVFDFGLKVKDTHKVKAANFNVSGYFERADGVKV